MSVIEKTEGVFGFLSSIVNGGSGIVNNIINLFFNPTAIWFIIGITFFIIIMYKLWVSDVNNKKYHHARKREI
jgi:hypothetical protein